MAGATGLSMLFLTVCQNAVIPNRWFRAQVYSHMHRDQMGAVPLPGSGREAKFIHMGLPASTPGLRNQASGRPRVPQTCGLQKDQSYRPRGGPAQPMDTQGAIKRGFDGH